jgi:phosphate uptake regulator
MVSNKTHIIFISLTGLNRGSRSTVLQKDRMMTRLSYIEKQAFELLSNAETASDRYLIQLVRLQRIFERIDDAVVNTASSVREADMHGFQTEIDQYKMTLSTEFSDNCEWHSSLKKNTHVMLTSYRQNASSLTI